MTPTCKARYSGGQMSCIRCGFNWDLDDLDLPTCLTNKQIKQQQGRQALDNIKKELQDGIDRDNIPNSIQHFDRADYLGRIRCVYTILNGRKST